MGGRWNGERAVCAERAQFNWIGNRSLSQPVVPLIYGKCIMQGGLRRQSNYRRRRRSTRPPNARTPVAFHRNYQFTSAVADILRPPLPPPRHRHVWYDILDVLSVRWPFGHRTIVSGAYIYRDSRNFQKPWFRGVRIKF